MYAAACCYAFWYPLNSRLYIYAQNEKYVGRGYVLIIFLRFQVVPQRGLASTAGEGRPTDAVAAAVALPMLNAQGLPAFLPLMFAELPLTPTSRQRKPCFVDKKSCLRAPRFQDFVVQQYRQIQAGPVSRMSCD
jgi:hypothetical protein